MALLTMVSSSSRLAQACLKFPRRSEEVCKACKGPPAELTCCIHYMLSTKANDKPNPDSRDGDIDPYLGESSYKVTYKIFS